MAKLLLVDDDRGTLSWMSSALVSLGHEVRTCASTKEALGVAGQWTPDLIVSDIMMPEIDGLEFARLARRYRRVPVLFVSIAAREADAVLAGASGYLGKPATAAEVRAAVQRVLHRGAARGRILVVDDDPDTRELHRIVLEPELEVVEAEHGEAALAVLARTSVDLVIADIHMPVMNGIELIRAMRADPAHAGTPVIVASNDRAAREAPVWRELHVAQVLDKHDFVGWLDQRIRAHLEHAVAPSSP